MEQNQRNLKRDRNKHNNDAGEKLAYQWNGTEKEGNIEMEQKWA